MVHLPPPRLSPIARAISAVLAVGLVATACAGGTASTADVQPEVGDTATTTTHASEPDVDPLTTGSEYLFDQDALH